VKEDNARILEKLWTIIEDRKKNPTPESYTCRLLKDRKLLEGKLFEELNELVKSRKKKGKDSAEWEAADLLYHLMVYMAARNVSWNSVLLELKGRMK
jgi:phosphoribosyl-ATP pyrophosphohydrolase